MKERKARRWRAWLRLTAYRSRQFAGAEKLAQSVWAETNMTPNPQHRRAVG